MIEPTAVFDVLPQHLPEHIARQRWSGAGERHITGVVPRWQEVVREGDPTLLWMVVSARYADGEEQDYQLFLGARSAESLPDFLNGKERETVAFLLDPAPGVIVYDALVDPELTIDVLHLTAPDAEVVVRRPIVLEHSNSSVVFDEARIMKVFRKIEPGPNPDVEIPRVLAEQGYEHVLPSLAELRRDGVDLVVLREFLVGCTEGWELARASVRDVLAGGEAPEESGADFAPDAERLGDVLAGLHIAMASAWGSEPGRGAGWAEQMQANLARAAAVEAEASGPKRLPVDAIAAELQRVAALDDAGQEIRIHGDLHLAQVLKTDTGWKVLDFEGEPARRRDDRFTRSSPLRDVAGMLRSLHYVAEIGLADWGSDAPEVADLARAWEARNRSAFLAGYFGTPGIGPLLPDRDEDRHTLLAGFELDKAVYEVLYELGHRPDLVRIPLRGIERLLRAGSTS
ncbi:MAG: maltokinase N-terminal cap-like domain-containing protein [Acidimicrobiia bacterium]